MNRTLLIMAALLAAAGATPANAQDSKAPTLAKQVCGSCHGPSGLSISSAFPRLAGQTAPYLQAQLRAFRNRTRDDPMAQAYMWGMAAQLDDGIIDELSAYYARQAPMHGPAPDAQAAAQGKVIFEQGIPASGVPACVTCHGNNGEGKDTFPRLAGQHAEYLVKQLSLFKSSLRGGSNAPIMHNVSEGMTFDQMTAVAAYLAGK